ncbi:MAG: cupin domain-containing protein [Acidobacteria bacterium]|nr:cupin domain-containing protein [Acidobacteriota bacterium]
MSNRRESVVPPRTHRPTSPGRSLPPSPRAGSSSPGAPFAQGTLAGLSPATSGIDRRAMIGRTLGAAAAGALLGAAAPGAPGVVHAQSVGAPSPGIQLPEGMRCIVTGHDAEGQSYVVSDERVSGSFPNVFRTTGNDPFGAGPEPVPRELLPTDSPQLEPAVGGANFHFVTLPPTPPDAPLGWHRTETVDMNVLLGGELVLVLDKEEVTVHPGDVVIQRNTMHAWRNPTSEPVYWVAVLVPIRQRA